MNIRENLPLIAIIVVLITIMTAYTMLSPKDIQSPSSVKDLNDGINITRESDWEFHEEAIDEMSDHTKGI
jgi:hypothetical protein